MQQTVTIGKKGGKGLEMGIISQVMLRIFAVFPPTGYVHCNSTH